MFQLDRSNVAHPFVDDPGRHQTATGRTQIGHSNVFPTPPTYTVQDLGVDFCKNPL